jgi:hypothetical protein
MSKPTKPLEQWADERAISVHDENQSIARDNRTLRVTLHARDEELAEVRKRLGVFEALDAAALSPPTWLMPPKRKAKDPHHVIPSMMLTDVHWGERVRSEEIGGVNCYDTRIAEQRIHRAGDGAIKLARDYLTGVEYDGFNLMLGGDLLGGDIHDELRETNVEYVTESVVGVLDPVIALIRLLADHFGKVHVAAVVGNHGRTTKRPRAKGRARDSFDGLVYRLVARELQADSRVTMQVASGADIHFPVYNTRYCLTHGDQFHGGSGISGFLTPLMLGSHRKRGRDTATAQPWDVLVMGHFHQSYFLNGLIVGGSVVGYNEFAYINNLQFEEPKASLWLNTSEHGISTYAPVFLLDRKSEGW